MVISLTFPTSLLISCLSYMVYLSFTSSFMQHLFIPLSIPSLPCCVQPDLEERHCEKGREDEGKRGKKWGLWG